jgi:hypothetical protein
MSIDNQLSYHFHYVENSSKSHEEHSQHFNKNRAFKRSIQIIYKTKNLACLLGA